MYNHLGISALLDTWCMFPKIERIEVVIMIAPFNVLIIHQSSIVTRASRYT